MMGSRLGQSLLGNIIITKDFFFSEKIIILFNNETNELFLFISECKAPWPFLFL